MQRLAVYPVEGSFAGVNKSWIGSGAGITEKIVGYLALVCIIHECDFGSRFCAVWSRVRLVLEVGWSPEAPCIS